MSEREKLMKKIAELSFAAVETNLYLDAYPDNREALAYFRKINDELERATEAYEEEYGPLTAGGDGYDEDFRWAKMPWPWQTEEN